MGGACQQPLVAIACGGTGGHLFPGLAVGEALRAQGVRVVLLVSRKEVDRVAVEQAREVEVLPLEAVGFDARRPWAFAWGALRSWRGLRARFGGEVPEAVLAMGGFTSAVPARWGRRYGARVFLHESNAIPGRANRWLARHADEVFVGFPEAARWLGRSRSTVTGTPVRRGFEPRDAGACRQALGLEPGRPTLVVTGGSQGARALNRRVMEAWPLMRPAMPQLQVIHLTGPHDVEAVRSVYAAAGSPAMVEAFSQYMDLVLGAASAVVSRAGASSLAELAAVRVPALLMPLPGAADDHQRANARALARTGAVRWVEQAEAEPARLWALLQDLLAVPVVAEGMRRALASWHRPDAAARIAARILPGADRVQAEDDEAPAESSADAGAAAAAVQVAGAAER